MPTLQDGVPHETLTELALMGQPITRDTTPSTLMFTVFLIKEINALPNGCLLTIDPSSKRGSIDELGGGARWRTRACPPAGSAEVAELRATKTAV